LHHIPYGEAWPIEDIRQRKAELALEGLSWDAVEAVPISEAIKARSGDCEQHLENYRITLRRLGEEGIKVVLNCFMPVLEWVRTDLSRELPDGKRCLSFNPIEFAAFELFLLKRPNADSDYSHLQLEQASRFMQGMSMDQRQQFCDRILGMLPGFHQVFTIAQLRDRLRAYEGIDAAQLKLNLKYFLEAVVPVAESLGIRLAMHPDDPPIPIFGLPRILSTESDFAAMCAMVDSPANGICFCTGSLGARADNDLPGMVDRLGAKIHAVHLRNVLRENEGAFYESDHLGGSVDMSAVVTSLLKEQTRRYRAGRTDFQLSFRPDHGHVMLDDLHKPPVKNPGYTCIGRMRGLAELRGLQHGISSVLK
jgi:mannonate dehydratase